MRPNTMRVCLAAGFLFVLLISIGTISGAETGKEYQITDNPGEQRYAYINENKIVWMDKRTGDYNIHIYDLGHIQHERRRWRKGNSKQSRT